MTVFRKLLVIDDSEVFRELISVLMKPYCERILVASSAKEAIALIDSTPDLDVAICDVMLAEENGFDVLRYVHALADPKPRVVMVTAYYEDAGVERADRLGAAGYLMKPASVRGILSAVQATAESPEGKRGQRWRCAGQAFVMDSGRNGSGLIRWDISNLSRGGAFLETKGPLPLGTELDLLLEIGGSKGRVRARVMRMQEPSWLDLGGVGVEFVECSPEAVEAIENAIERAEDKPS